MNQEIRVCKNCKKEFLIETEDFVFYEKIQVPSPTWCPDCRLQRRLSWRNERYLYKRKCSAPTHKEELISMYSFDKPFTVYDKDYWWGDNWDPVSYGKDYYFSRPFFEQLRELMENIPFSQLINFQDSDCAYNNFLYYSKNCYLCFLAQKLEDCAYVTYSSDNKSCFDSDYILNCESVFECIDCVKCYKCFYSRDLQSCSEVMWSLNCRNCSNCVGCINLRNKSYCIFNEEVGRGRYQTFLKQLVSGQISYEEIREKLETLVKKSIFKENKNLRCVNCKGDRIHNSQNVSFSFDVYNAQDSKFLSLIALGDEGMIIDCYDCSVIGSNQLIDITL